MSIDTNSRACDQAHTCATIGSGREEEKTRALAGGTPEKEDWIRSVQNRAGKYDMIFFLKNIYNHFNTFLT